MIKKQYFDYVNVLKYVVIAALCVVFNNLEKTVMPYSYAVYVSALALGSNPFFTSIIYIGAFALSSSFGLLGFAGITALFNAIVFFIYRKTNSNVKYEFLLYVVMSCAVFLLLGDTSAHIGFNKRLTVSAFTVIISVVTFIGGKAVAVKGLKCKPEREELAAMVLFTVLLGLGISNLLSPLVWKGISVLFVLLCCYLFRTGVATVFSAILGISLSVFYGDVDYVAIFLLWGLTAESLMKVSRYLAAVAVIACDFLTQYFFAVYINYDYYHLCAVAAGAAAFCLIPAKPLLRLKEKLYSFREKQLVRQSINRNRTLVSNRLFEISGVFTEMSNAFSVFKKTELTEELAKKTIFKSVMGTVCADCKSCALCKEKRKAVSVGIMKMIDIGFAKGKLTLIDMPKSLSEACVHPNSVIFGLNKLLADYRRYVAENSHVKANRALLADEMSGVADILRSLAVESGAQLKYQSRIERMVSDRLMKNGINVLELLIYGEQTNLSVGIIIPSKIISFDNLQKIVSDTLKIPMCVTEKINITEDKLYVHLKRSVSFDAVFGLSKAKKENSPVSGDTHSVTRISEDKFLVALSDGMGSGAQAETVASASLSLIESFYKAGLNGNLVLDTVNKFMSVNTEESFTALDVGVINLNSCRADFIKYGAPYGFIINDNGIRIVEGNSLPLGILDDLKPTVCTSALADGDVLLMLTDGISDAFGSSGDIIDFLRKLPAKNPQTLTDTVLSKALELTGGEKKDDMTALAVRIFKKVS